MALLKMIIPFPQVRYVSFLEGRFLNQKSPKNNLSQPNFTQSFLVKIAFFQGALSSFWSWTRHCRRLPVPWKWTLLFPGATDMEGRNFLSWVSWIWLMYFLVNTFDIWICIIFSPSWVLSKVHLTCPPSFRPFNPASSQEGRRQCIRSDGRLDLHYFAVSWRRLRGCVTRVSKDLVEGVMALKLARKRKWTT